MASNIRRSVGEFYHDELCCSFQIDIDDCGPPVCDNGANCTDGYIGFYCTCAAGFTGSYCQNVIPPTTLPPPTTPAPGEMLAECLCADFIWPQHQDVLSSAVIMRFNIVGYFIDNYRHWSRISIRCWIHKSHTITGELWGVFCEYLWQNWPRYNGTALYLYLIWFLSTGSALN